MAAPQIDFSKRIRRIPQHVEILPHEAAFPLASLRQQKYWSPVGRVDNVYGDRNLFCACVPVAEYESA